MKINKLLMITGVVLATPFFVSAATVAPVVSAQIQQAPLTDGFTHDVQLQNICVNLQNNLSYRASDSSTNGEVSVLQDFLNVKGYLSGDPTGHFGIATLAAVKKFQSAVGIGSSKIVGYGDVGPKSRAKIKDMTCAPLISVTSPKGGEVLTMGTLMTIAWKDSTPAPACSSDVYDGNGNVIFHPVCTVAPAKYDIQLVPYTQLQACDGVTTHCTGLAQIPSIIATGVTGSSYVWGIGSTPSTSTTSPSIAPGNISGGSYTIQICKSGSSIACGTSKTPFNISGTSVPIITPVTPCLNGATNPPLCTPTVPVIPGGPSSEKCLNGATNPPVCTPATTTTAQPLQASVIGAFSQEVTPEVSMPATPTLSYVWGHNLEIGSSYTNDISALQKALSSEGLYSGEITGGFYSQTYLAVKAFQTKYNIEATGFVGSDTRTKLNELYK